jgi:hypothetical protein
MSRDQNKLKEKCRKAINTTMIGSLFIIEQEMSKQLQDPELNKLYKLIREKILDLGNEQINRLEDSFKKFEITSKLNSYVFKKDKDGNQD